MSQDDESKKNKTTKRGTGNAGRKKVKPQQGPVDPPRPETISYATLDKDPRGGDAFRFDWVKGACKGGPKRIQCEVLIREPASWARDNIVITEISALDSLEYGTKKVSFHRAVVPQFQAFFKTVEVKGLKGKLITHVGGYVSRTLTGKPALLSTHALGTAIDLNARWNDFGAPPARRGSYGSVAELADFCADFGIYWGGWYKKTKDAMHFECVKLQSELELQMACKKHKVDYDEIKALSPPLKAR